MRDFILKASHIEKPLINYHNKKQLDEYSASHGILVDFHVDVELFHTVVEVVEMFKVGLFSLG